MKISKLLPLWILVACSFASATPQGTRADYDRSADLQNRWKGLWERFQPKINWLPDGQGLWWRDSQKTFVRIDAKTGQRQESKDPVELGLADVDQSLAPMPSWKASRSGGEATQVLFRNTFKRPVRLFWVDTQGQLKAYGSIEAQGERPMATFGGHVWVLDFAKDDLCGIFEAADWDAEASIDEISRDITRRKSEAKPVPTERFVVEDHNVILISADGKRTALTTDGTSSDPYRRPLHPSPGGKRLLAFRRTDVPARRIPLLDSTPDGEGFEQPKLEWINYNKPGDPLGQSRPRLIDIKRKTLVPISVGAFKNTYSVRLLRWAPDSKTVYCLVNHRGHQRLQVLAIDARTGKIRTIVDERSETFVDYSQKSQMHWLEEKPELLWGSERDGWNHLYRIDAQTGSVRNQVTKGSWVVRSIAHVDEAKGQVWFKAMGIVPGQDPYHEHLARVNLDGSGLVVLTKGDGTHKTEFNADRSLFVDRWSRVDLPQVTELRRAVDGELVLELGRDDAQGLLDAGFTYPERFHAKGRDGQTDIHGILIRPSNFKKGRKYPVIESIYAGPHGQHVPKKFGLGLRVRKLAELGFIVVQIDGMGTNWRSKAFHDVCWQNLKDAGLPDRILWMQAAGGKYPELDLDNVGIFGGSAGGQNALSAVLHYGDFYDAAAADCGCHDNRMDKIWWNEAWMGAMGPHYADSSNVTHAHLLQGKLLLTVGEMDRNVDPASTLQVVDALVRADKDFEFVWVPGAGHGIGEGKYLQRRRQDFFVRALYSREPRL